MIKPIVLALVASLALAACASTASFSSDFDAEQDFSAYKTFSWAGDSPMTVFGEALIPPTAEPKIARAIQGELEAKGYRYVADRAEADFAVSFTVGTRSEERVTQVPTRFYGNAANWRWGRPYYPGLYPALYPQPATVSEVRVYNKGTLAIDIFDVERRSPVWHGAGVKTLSGSQLDRVTLPEPEVLRAGVASILEDFPPQ
ncbi:MAG: DUF4136 domain-containing protein [Erythrobacter sp.]|uniref:DUF4136 domain-containing protein n=1 Tax=Erythrobacter sp. TaxID=1042 RepID=UPI00260E514C|nr:DUF4136 domain-containing protein [Erythrobacter sp.]MDJ0979764.1 DUF4136 domain-containing protein [Erythrobacter sp.]